MKKILSALFILLLLPSFSLALTWDQARLIAEQNSNELKSAQKQLESAEWTYRKSFSKGQYFLSYQLKRASLSIITNISEGSGRWHSKDKRYFYLIARGSAYECVAIIDSYRKIQQFPEEVMPDLLADLLDISKMLTKLIQRFS